jgi:uncharacterized protein YprB with RNaseH-like and TPR domain
MLSSSFIHVRGVGAVTEQRIWQHGVTSWDAFLDAPEQAGLSRRATQSTMETIATSRAHLQRKDHRYFAQHLPSGEHWRAWPEFPDRIAFLDIETTGMSDDDAVTMVGVYDGTTARAYLKGDDLQEFAEDITQYQLLVTFFGNGFDLPFLRRRFPSVRLDQLHIDLCPALRRLGYKGGLKSIEEQLHIPRAPETIGLSGFDAVRLWYEWERGSRAALELLKAYNAEDIINLRALLEFAYPRLRARAGFPE